MNRLAFTIGLCGLLLACATPPPPCPCPVQPPPAATPAAPSAPDRLALEPLMDSVVQIRVKIGAKVVAGQREETYEHGTGFFVNERGRILTSAHVLGTIDDPRSLSVLVAGRSLQARILKVDRKTDLAVLLVDAGQTKPLTLAEEPTQLGAKVYAVGYPFVDVFSDAAPAVSVGHVAGTSRSIDYEGQQVADLLLTDAFVADGCSGGPLLSQDGEVIGVLRFNLSRKGTWLGLSFAQPIAAYRALYGGEK